MRCVVFLCFSFIFQYTSKNLEHPETISGVHSNDWMVRITSGIDIATTIAHNEGFNIIDESPEVKIYRFSNLNSNDENIDDIQYRLTRYEEVSFAEPIVFKLHSNGYDKSMLASPQDPDVKNQPKLFCAGPELLAEEKLIKTNVPLPYNDPLYRRQWFMRSCREIIEHVPSYYDIKLTQLRQDYNLYGEGIKVLVMDDGVITNHEDLTVDLNYSYDFVSKKKNPSPENEDSHGTWCAGIIGMKENNEICGVGIAPHATVGGLRVFSQRSNSISTYNTMEAFKFRAPEVDIISRSLYAQEDQAFDPVHTGEHSGIDVGIKEGRRGKGIIYVFIAANGKRTTHTCSTRYLENSIYSITIGGVSNNGKASDYAERCAAIMVTMYSGNDYPYAIPTINIKGGIKCWESFKGTSAAAPMAAGLFALVLEANPELTWREVQHLIAWTSEIAPLTKNAGWTENAAGFYVSLDFGFGLLNVYDMVEMAQKFKKLQPLPAMNTCSTSHSFSAEESSFNLKNSKVITLNTDGCKGSPMAVNYLEHVHLTISLKYPIRGDLQIILISPLKTKVHILEPRLHDKSSDPIRNYSFQSIHTWGENPIGPWTIELFDAMGSEDKEGKIFSARLTFYGTKDEPDHYKQGKRKYYPFSFDKSYM